MRWRKLGLVFNAREQLPEWADNSALTPLPFLHADGHIRVYAGFRDRVGVSRIGYVDLAAQDPSRILGVSRRPVLDVGRDGCFDDNGVILGDLVRADGLLYLFYVGFQLVAKAKFIALTGLAVSHDEGESFSRVCESPFLGRADGQNMIAAIHSVHYKDGRWRFWYAAGNDWEWIAGKPYPRYGIRHLSASSLVPTMRLGDLCLEAKYPEYRIGRPRVYRSPKGFEMHFTSGNVSGGYTPGRAFSRDGILWERDKTPFEPSTSGRGWDSRHLCYPAILEVMGRRYMFYNGNDMGVDGFGCAVLEAE